MIVDKKFIIEVAKQKKYTFISTGMSTIENIDEAVNIFKKQDCPFELMHCVSAYPFEDGKANLHLIKFLKERYNCDVGYSGHEKGGLAISYAASALGISSLERHITLDRTMYGSDQAASLTIKGFEQLVDGVRKIELAVNGKEKKRILEEEIEISKKLRAHIKFR